MNQLDATMIYWSIKSAQHVSGNLLPIIRSVRLRFLQHKLLLHIVNEQRNILHEIRKRKANWIGHILRRNCLLKQVIEGKIKGKMEVARRRGRRRKKLLDDLKDRRGYSHLKEEALDSTMWRHRFGGGFGPVVRQNTEWMNYIYIYIYVDRLKYLKKIESKIHLQMNVHELSKLTINILTSENICE